MSTTSGGQASSGQAPNQPAGEASGRRPRTRPAPRRVEVRRVTPINAAMVTVTVGGAALAGFDLPRTAHHLKIFLPAPGQDEPALPVFGPEGPSFPADQPRPVVRTYTPRRFDPDALELDLEMLLHEGGPAGQWAARAKPGDRLAIAGPGGGYDIVPEAPHHLLAADETGLPALATILERLPAGARVTVLAEVRDAGRELPLPVPGAGPGARPTVRGADDAPPGMTLIWLHRADRPAGELLAETVEALVPAPSGKAGTSTPGGESGSGHGHEQAGRHGLPAGSVAWAACEATAVRRIRRHLLSAGFDRSALSTRGYWRYGAADHPDHDYGEGDVNSVARPRR